MNTPTTTDTGPRHRPHRQGYSHSMTTETDDNGGRWTTEMCRCYSRDTWRRQGYTPPGRTSTDWYMGWTRD